MKRWDKFCKTETEKASKESEEFQDSFTDMVKYANRHCFPNIRILLAIRSISPIELIEQRQT